jgi:hypothetical protein
METRILEYANEWFRLHGIPTFIDDGSMYVQVSDGFELQLSTSEVNYRAELFLESEKQKTL